MYKWCYVDGKIVESTKPQIKLGDVGLLRGYAVFDFIKVVNGLPLFWPEHLKRFKASAKLLAYKIRTPACVSSSPAGRVRMVSNQMGKAF